jgi:molybdopterin-binding protein
MRNAEHRLLSVLADHLTVSQAARRIGVSPGTFRRWIYNGRVAAVRDGGIYLIPVDEVRRLIAERHVTPQTRTKRDSGTNRFTGTVNEVEDNGLMSQIEILVTDPVHLVATITADAAKQMNLKPGEPVTAIFRATAPFLFGPETE